MSTTMKFLAALVAALAISTAQADTHLSPTPNPFLGIPSYDYCHFERGEYRATAGTLSTSGDPFFNSSTGTGATLEDNTSPYTGGWGATVTGTVREEFGTGAGSDTGARTSTILFNPGMGAASYYFAGREIALSDGTQTYVQRIGLIDSDAESNDGIFFRYTNGTNSGKWQAVIRDNGSETAADTTVTFTANTARTFRIEVSADGTSATFYIDGTATNSNVTGANMPDAGDYTGFGWAATRSSSTTADTNPMALDVEVFQIQLNVPRC